MAVTITSITAQHDPMHRAPYCAPKRAQLPNARQPRGASGMLVWQPLRCRRFEGVSCQTTAIASAATSGPFRVDRREPTDRFQAVSPTSATRPNAAHAA